MAKVCHGLTLLSKMKF